jgi:hypothetical protein
LYYERSGRFRAPSLCYYHEISRNPSQSSETTTTDPDNSWTPLVRYLDKPGHVVDRNVRRQALKYVLLDNTLYHRTIDGLLLKFLASDQSKIAMGEVHKGICGTHQSGHKMKWLFHLGRVLLADYAK